MRKSYMVFSYQSPPDPQKLAAYGKLAIPAFELFGAPFWRVAMPRRLTSTA
jgi:hypothetical protein